MEGARTRATAVIWRRGSNGQPTWSASDATIKADQAPARATPDGAVRRCVRVPAIPTEPAAQCSGGRARPLWCADIESVLVAANPGQQHLSSCTTGVWGHTQHFRVCFALTHVACGEQGNAASQRPYSSSSAFQHRPRSPARPATVSANPPKMLEPLRSSTPDYTVLLGPEYTFRKSINRSYSKSGASILDCGWD